MKNNTLYACAAIVLAAVGIYYYNQPRTYEDCLLANMDGAETTQATLFIRAACQKKFPESFKATQAKYPEGAFDDIFFPKD